MFICKAKCPYLIGPEIRQNPEAIEIFAKMIQTTRLMKAGVKPPEYTQACHCKSCGWVWLWDGCPGEVLGCPWCIIRASGVSIPQPPPSPNDNTSGYYDS